MERPAGARAGPAGHEPGVHGARHGRRPLLDGLGAAERRGQPGDPAARVPGRRLLRGRRPRPAVARRSPTPTRSSTWWWPPGTACSATPRWPSALSLGMTLGLAVAMTAWAWWTFLRGVGIRTARRRSGAGREWTRATSCAAPGSSTGPTARHLIAIAAVDVRAARRGRGGCSRGVGWPGVVAANVLSLAAIFLVQGALVKAVEDVSRRPAPTSGVAPRPAATRATRLVALAGAGLLAALGIFVGLALLIVPGLVLLTWWLVLAPVIMLEHRAGRCDELRPQPRAGARQRLAGVRRRRADPADPARVQPGARARPHPARQRAWRAGSSARPSATAWRRPSRRWRGR